MIEAALDLGIRAIDTSFNYRGFASHTTLARVAGDLLPKFEVSTKIGFLPGPGKHSLSPVPLWKALGRTLQDLEHVPDVVFLHNPERTLARLPPDRQPEVLATAFAVLSEAVDLGMCRRWGVASWNPERLPDLPTGSGLVPQVLMVPAGLLVGAQTLEAADSLTKRWHEPTMWGMSPFGGSFEDPIWDRVDPRIFLRSEAQECSRAQAALRVAYCLPEVRRVAVGSDDPTHLRELVNALDCSVDEAKIRRYRCLLRERGGNQRP
ncbi:aldo/keto reductase [Streptomyces sp. NPDC020379]|uniref:aldo/keto reductase n=1 Tax=Streptomyces sp. NPDC020379 TaxID=3365071 RepID=UPI0037B12415